MLFNGIWGGESVRAEAGRWECENIHRRAGYLRGRRITEWTWKITRTEWKWNYCIWRSQQLFCTPTITHTKKRRESHGFTSTRKITFSVDAQTVVFLLRHTATKTEAIPTESRDARVSCIKHVRLWEVCKNFRLFYLINWSKKRPNSFSNKWKTVFM